MPQTKRFVHRKFWPIVLVVLVMGCGGTSSPVPTPLATEDVEAMIQKALAEDVRRPVHRLTPLATEDVEAMIQKALAEDVNKPSLTVVPGTGVHIPLLQDVWTTVQLLSIDVPAPGHVQISAFGGESVLAFLRADYRAHTSFRTLIGIGPDGAFNGRQADDGPTSYGTFVVACCAGGGFSYRVGAYSVSETYRIGAPGSYTYKLYARSPGGGVLNPGSMTAIFIPD